MTDPNSHKDYQDFLHSNQASPSKHLNEKVLAFVQADLNPSHKTVFFKLIAVQTFIGVITLTFCPQFSLSLTNNLELFHFFHHSFGAKVCMILCGSIFIGSGAVFAAYLLKASEIRKIKESMVLYYTCLSIIALSSFFLLGAQVYLTMALYWLAGSIIGGIISFELNRLLRREVFNY